MTRRLRLRQVLALLVLSALGGCENRDLVIYLDWPPELDRAQIEAVRFLGFPTEIDSPQRDALLLDKPFVYRIPETVNLPLDLEIKADVLTQGGCRAGEGSVSTQVSSSHHGPATLHLPLTAFNPQRCTLSVSVLGGGQVRSDPVGIDCPSKACSWDFPPNTPIRLDASAEKPAYRAYVFDTKMASCAGYGPCAFTLTGEQRIPLRFLPATCATSGWCKQSVPGSGATRLLSGVSGKQPGDVVMIGDGGTILRLGIDGMLNELKGPGQSFLFGISGGSERWAVGAGGTLWKVAASGVTAASESGTLTPYNLTAVTSDPISQQAWSVGLQGSLLRRQSGVWSVDAAQPDIKGKNLTGVWAASATSIWAVGENGIILHSDGSEWKTATATPPTNQDLHAVWGSSDQDIWVGGSNTVLHYNGTSWASVTPPTAPYDFYAISGTSSSDIWMVGELGSIWHYDGIKWQKRPESGVLTTKTLFGVDCASPWEAWAVGDAGTLLVYQP